MKSRNPSLSYPVVCSPLPWLLLACLWQGGAVAEMTVHARAITLTPTQTLEEAVKQGNVEARESYARQRYGQEIHRGFGTTAFTALFLRSEDLPGLIPGKVENDPHRGRRDRVFAGLDGIRFTRQFWQDSVTASPAVIVQDSRWTFPAAWNAKAFLAQRLPTHEGLSPHVLPTTPEHALGAENFHVFVGTNMGKPAAKAGAPDRLHWRFLILRDNVVAELDIQQPHPAASQKNAASHGLDAELATVLPLARMVQARLETGE